MGTGTQADGLHLSRSPRPEAHSWFKVWTLFFFAWKLARLKGRDRPSQTHPWLVFSWEVIDSGDLSVTHSKLPLFPDPQPKAVRMVSWALNLSTGEKDAEG